MGVISLPLLGFTYRPIETAHYGDIVCLDPYSPFKNESMWMFLGRASEGYLRLMVLNLDHWSGMVIEIPDEGFVVVEA